MGLLEKYLPNFLQDVLEFQMIFDVDDSSMTEINSDVSTILSDMFITTATEESIARLESFLRIKGQGTLSQRRSYLIALLQKGNKLNETSIKNIANTITGSDCRMKFYAADEISANHPEPGFGVILLQVLSPDPYKDYKYDDILRTLQPLIPGHIKLVVVKYFARWLEVRNLLASWQTVKTEFSSWSSVKGWVPPEN